ncbi:hypothetical protein [Spirosoma utsteinense]|uniref:hypothetical protein n=1 Tax=Spirosoma utsteinense TaxID=2585773 RepID=UPI0016486183|nr:hypothetical protein [Spirosoma utsteinense]MBC3788657.1 hypothetical protein [Spirosoma utsteinense]
MVTAHGQKDALDELAKLVVKPQLFNVEDIIRMARLLKKTPTEIFESILTEITEMNIGLMDECQMVADKVLDKKYNQCHN